MINPGEQPIDNANLELAAENIQAFVDEFTDRGGHLEDEPYRDETLDEGGRYGWVLPLVGGRRLPVLMPGRPLDELKSLEVSTPCLRIGATWWWWNDAVSQAIPIEPGRYQD